MHSNSYIDSSLAPVPVTFPAVCYVFVNRYTPFWSLQYVVLSFLLPAIEVTITAVALRLLWRYHGAIVGNDETSRRSKLDLIVSSCSRLDSAVVN